MQRLLHGLQPAPVAGIVEDKVPTPFAERRPATNAGLRRRFVLLGFTAVLAACGLPQQGPRSPEILDGADQGQYVLLDVDTAITQRLGRPQRSSLGGFGKAIAARPSQAITIGDTLDIRILEAGGGGLFARAEKAAPVAQNFLVSSSMPKARSLCPMSEPSPSRV